MSRPSILVVDDKPTIVGLLVKVLGKLAHVTPARGAREAVAAVERRPFAAVVCDLRMPDGDGLDVLRAVQARSPATPFILMTAYASIASAVQATREGAFDYVTKPFDPDDLRALVARALAVSAGHAADESQDPGAGGGDVPAQVHLQPQSPETDAPAVSSRLTFREALAQSHTDAARRYLEAVLVEHKGDVAAAAVHAGVGRESFYRLLRRFGLVPGVFRQGGG